MGRQMGRWTDSQMGQISRQTDGQTDKLSSRYLVRTYLATVSDIRLSPTVCLISTRSRQGLFVGCFSLFFLF